MNSQPNIKERNTFGIANHSDILGSHLQERTLSLEDYKRGSLNENRDRNKEYKLLVDHRTLEALYEKKTINAIVSFQRRTTGNFAVARIYQPTKAFYESND